jgi:RNA polymerase sigma-70 factor, ECF subfamily
MSCAVSSPSSAARQPHDEVQLQAEFDFVVRRYRARLVSMASRYRLSIEAAEDAVQRGLLKAWAGLPKFRRDAQLSSWLTAIVVNEVLQTIRKDKRAVMVPITADNENFVLPPEHQTDPAHSPEAWLLLKERMEQIDSAMQCLSPAMRGAVALNLLHELPVKEAARLLEISLPSAKSRISRGRRALKKKLRAQDMRDRA